MKLLTEKIKKAIPPLYGPETEFGCKDPRFVCKFFDPCGSWTWYVLEGEELENGDWRFYGLVDGDYKEWGYFLLSELQRYSGAFALGIERDIHFENEETKKYV